MRTEKRFMRAAFEATLAKFARPNHDVTLWTIESKSIDPWLDLVWGYFEQLREQEAERKSQKNQEAIRRRAARFSVDANKLAEAPLSLNN